MFKSLVLKAFVVLSLGAADAFFLTGCTKKETRSEWVIGQFETMTGSEATFGQSTNDGVVLAIEEANAKGGVKGKKIKLVTMDDQGKAEEAASVVTRLVDQEKILALLGEVASSRSLAAAPIAQNKHIPMITPSSTNPGVTQVGNYIFRTCFIDPFQGTVMAKYTAETLKLKKVAIVRDVKSDYSMGLADFFIEKFKALGGEIVADVSYQSDDVDFKAQLTSIKGTKPQALYIPGYYGAVGLIARQAHELGLQIPLLGGDGWDSPKLSEIGGKDIDGGIFSNHYSNETTDPVATGFIARFKAKYHRMPDGLSAAGYDAAAVLIQAMQNTTEVTSEQIREQLTQIVNFPGVTGKITINDQRNAVKSAVIVKVEGTNNKYVTTINP